MRELKYMPKWFGNIMYPHGFPLSHHNERWHGNIKDDLVQAIKNYYSFKVDGKPELTEYEKELLFEYVMYHINAPCLEFAYDASGDRESIEILIKLRKQADGIKTLDQLSEFIFCCLDVGIDPL